MNAAPRRPDYRLRYLNKVTDERGTIGAAWKNADGSISVVLDPKVTLTQDRNEVLTLFLERSAEMQNNP